MKQQQRRATFEDVRHAQNTIRVWIDGLILKNKPLTENEREKFIKLMQLASLGIGTAEIFMITTREKTHNFPHIESALYWVCYQENAKVKLGNETIQIKEIWKKIKTKWCFEIFPYALQESIKISKEQTHLGAATAKEV